MTTTLIRNVDYAIAWDGQAHRHVYLTHTDIAFTGNQITHVGPGFRGTAEREIDGTGLMAMPGLVDLHCHPFSEPMNKGMWDEIGSPHLYNTSLYEHLPVLEPDAEGTPACYRVALSELLLSGVTTICDLSVPSESWLDLLAESGIRAYVAPMYRSARWFTRTGMRLNMRGTRRPGNGGWRQRLAWSPVPSSTRAAGYPACSALRRSIPVLNRCSAIASPPRLNVTSKFISMPGKAWLSSRK